MEESADKAFKQAAAFQKMWLDTFTTMNHVFADFSPGKPPPEQIRSMRSGMLKVLAESWDEFMRSEEFMGMMKHSVDNITQFKKMSNDMLTKAHQEVQAPARQDIDSVLLAIRHSERMVLERVDDLTLRVNEIEANMANKPAPTSAKKTAPAKRAKTPVKKAAKKVAKKAKK